MTTSRRRSSTSLRAQALLDLAPAFRRSERAPSWSTARPVSSSGRSAPFGRHRSPWSNRTPVTATSTSCGVGHFQLPQVGHFRLPLKARSGEPAAAALRVPRTAAGRRRAETERPPPGPPGLGSTATRPITLDTSVPSLSHDSGPQPGPHQEEKRTAPPIFPFS